MFHPLREDEEDIDFSDTKGFVAQRYEFAVAAVKQSLSVADRESVNQPGDWQKAQSYIRQIIADPPTPHPIKRLLAHIDPLPRSLYTLVGQFEGAIHPSVPDVNIIWGLTELNIKVRRRPINLGSEIADIGESCHVNPQRSSLRLWAG